VKVKTLAPAFLVVAATIILGTSSACIVPDRPAGGEVDETQIMQNRISELDGRVKDLEVGNSNLQGKILSLEADLSSAREAVGPWDNMGVVLVLGGAAVGVGVVAVTKRK
jgi:hypothetical protein